MKTFPVYPCNFNSTLKKKEGRKYGLRNCLENPTIDEILDACKKLCIEDIVYEKKIHPRTQEEGRILITKKLLRNATIGAIKQQIIFNRSEIELKNENIKKIEKEKKDKNMENNQEIPKKTVLVPKSKKKKAAKKEAKRK